MADVAMLAEHQNRIYVDGLAGRLPTLPLAYEELERRAEQQLSRGAHGYVAGGAGSEDTMRANREAFRRWRIAPRMLRDVSHRDLSTSVCGTAMPAPVLLAPVGVQGVIHLAYLPFLHGEGMADYLSDPVFHAALDVPPEEDVGGAIRHFLRVFSDASVTWERLALLRESTRLPILLEGILHPDDARRAADHGVDGIVVSNHGGRQVDGAVAALDALPAVVEAVPDSLPVLFDSGIRTASDAVVALALGARAVLLGRPYVWALAAGGEAGVAELLRNLLAELDLTLALSGHTGLDALVRESLVRAG